MVLSVAFSSVLTALISVLLKIWEMACVLSFWDNVFRDWFKSPMTTSRLFILPCES